MCLKINICNWRITRIEALKKGSRRSDKISLKKRSLIQLAGPSKTGQKSSLIKTASCEANKPKKKKKREHSKKFHLKKKKCTLFHECGILSAYPFTVLTHSKERIGHSETQDRYYLLSFSSRQPTNITAQIPSIFHNHGFWRDRPVRFVLHLKINRNT